MRKYLVFLIICVFCLQFVAYAQQSTYRFEHLTKANGLSNTTVQVIYLDRFGFLWIGTENGLNRFDGKTMTVYKEGSDSTSLMNNKILSIKEDPEGNLWVGAVVGLHKYNRAKDNFERFPIREGNNGLSDKSINDFFWDKESNIWIGTSKGLNQVNLKTKKIKRWFDKKTASMNEERITGIVQDKNGTIWISTFNGLKAYDKKTDNFRSYTNSPLLQNSISNNSIYSLFLDKEDYLWVSTQAGLNQFNTKTGSAKRFLHDASNPNSLLSSEVNMSYRYGNQVFVATFEGLSVIDLATDKITNISTIDEQGILSKIIQAVYVDRYGSLWVGSKFGGVDLYSKYASKFTHYHHSPNDPNGLSYNLVTGFSEDENHNIWVSTDGGGLNYFDKKQGYFGHLVNSAGNSNTVSTNKTLFNMMDKDQNLWVCTWAGGLNRYNQKTKNFQHYHTKAGDSSSLSTDCPYYVFQDSDGDIWVGLWNGGLNKYDKKTNKFIRYPLANEAHKELRKITITAILEDKDKNLWLATEGYGIYVYNKYKGTYTLYSYTEANPWELKGNDISALYRDSKNRIWVGTNGAGLAVYDPNAKNFKIPENIKNQMSNAITGIAEDHQHNLWLSSGNGVSKLSINEKDGKTMFAVKNYNKSDGLQDLQFVRWAVHQTKSGEILFGGQNGFNIFMPDSIKDNPFAPQVYFTQFLLFNKPVAIGDSSILKENITYAKEITLTHHESVFTFQFCALNYVNSWKNQFACKMEGFNKDWIDLGGKNEATYTNLDPGTYTFKVKACNNDGVWTEQPAEIRIIVLPPWWKTWWFRTFVIASVLGAVIGYFLIRMKNIRLQKEHLERLVAIRTQELSSANAVLIEQKEELFQQSEEIAAQRDELEIQNQQITKAFNSNKLLSEFGQKITANLNAKSIQTTIFEYISSLIKVSTFGIGIYEPKRNVLVFDDFVNNDTKYEHILQHLRIDSYPTRCFSSKSEILTTKNEQIDQELLKVGSKALDAEIQSLFLIPLMTENIPIGMLIVGCRQENAYASNELNTLRTLASYLAIALDNAHAYGQISIKNGLIEGSIRYAQNIQKAILPSKLLIESYFESYILFKPRDVVSGDFYWFNIVKTGDRERIYAAVLDCTGHGVPGAFMSMIGKSLINEIVNEKEIFSPAEILTQLNISIGKALRQKETGNNDGMDVCLCLFEATNEPEHPYLCTYAGAKLPLYQYSSETQEMLVHQGTKRSIGGTNLIKEEAFVEIQIPLSKGDGLYLSTDGYRDQNNADRKRLGSKKMLECIQSIAQLSMGKQQLEMERLLSDHSQNEEQRDDITVMGLRI